MSDLPQFPGCVCHDIIGEGSCGTVYSGTWEDDTPVAVKVFKPEAINREYVKHCLDSIGGAAPHSGLVQVFDHDLDGDPAYCVMGLLLDSQTDPPQPHTLESLCGQMPAEEAWLFASQLADAMAHLHQTAGIAHCGIKTSNIFVDDDGEKVELRVTDPGQGWIGGVERLALNDHTFYAAPEQLAHPEQLFEGGFQTWDTYAFGVTVYRMLTGMFPRFEQELDNLRERIENNPEESIVFDPFEYASAAHNYPEVFWPDEARPSPTELARREIIEKCLALDPEQRFANMQSVASALAGIRADAPTLTQTHSDHGLERDATENAPISGMAEVAAAAPPAATVHYVTPSKWRTILPWAIAAVFAAGAGVFYKLHSDVKTTLAEEREGLRTALAGAKGELESRNADIQTNVSLVDEAALHASNAVENQIQAQRNLAKAQDTADFFFTAFLESGSASANTPDRRIAFTRAETFYQGFLSEIDGDPNLLDSAARATLNLALIQKGLNKNEEAEVGFAKAAGLLGDLIEKDPSSTASEKHLKRKASAQASSAELLLERGAYEKGLAVLEDTADAYRPLSDEISDNPQLRNSIASTYHQTGWALRHLDRDADAISQQARVIELLDHVSADPNTSPRDALLLSKSLFERGRCQLSMGDAKSAADDHMQAVEILLEIFQMDRESAGYRLELGRNYWALGEALAENGLWTDAGRSHTEAVKFLKELVEESPDVAEYKMLLALDYASVAQIQRDRGKPESALEFHRGTVAFLSSLVEKSTATDLQRHQLAVQKGTHAELLAINKQPAKAIEEANQAVFLLQEIVIKQEPGTQLQKDFRTNLAELYGTLGDIAEKTGDGDAAVQAFLKAIHDWESLMPTEASDPIIEKKLEWCRERVTKLDPEALDAPPETEKDETAPDPAE